MEDEINGKHTELLPQSAHCLSKQELLKRSPLLHLDDKKHTTTPERIGLLEAEEMDKEAQTRQQDILASVWELDTKSKKAIKFTEEDEEEPIEEIKTTIGEDTEKVFDDYFDDAAIKQAAAVKSYAQQKFIAQMETEGGMVIQEDTYYPAANTLSQLRFSEPISEDDKSLHTRRKRTSESSCEFDARTETFVPVVWCGTAPSSETGTRPKTRKIYEKSEATIQDQVHYMTEQEYKPSSYRPDYKENLTIKVLEVNTGIRQIYFYL